MEEEQTKDPKLEATDFVARKRFWRGAQSKILQSSAELKITKRVHFPKKHNGKGSLHI